ncbi:MAG TPA: M13 family metallopeptidase [Steroidobacteraceae bacterium]
MRSCIRIVSPSVALVTALLLGGGTPSAWSADSAGGDPLAGMDRSVRPGDDFSAFVNGDWAKSTEIPADRSTTSTGRDLAELTNRRNSDLIRQLASSNPPRGSNERKVADYYDSFMDEATIESKGLSVLKPSFDRIAAISDRVQLARYLGTTLRADVDVLNATNFYTDNVLGLWVAQDLDDPSHYSVFLLQGGLGMPDRDYYLSDSPQMQETRARYREHIVAYLKLAGIADPEHKAAAIDELERRLAASHSTRTESEDVQRGHNHWTRRQLHTDAPGLDWDALLNAAGLGHERSFIAWQPGALETLAALAGSEPLATWKVYLQYHAITHHARYLGKAFVDEQFAFYGKVLQGTPQMPERWKRAVADTDQALGLAVGKLYVERYFPASSKASVEQMVHNLLSAFSTGIDALDWMAPQTKTEAKAKLAALRVGIGYPDQWRDYSALKVVRGDAFGNGERAALFELQRNLHKLGKPVDRSEWVMNPQLVNAVNLPALNALNLPAAILQPPYFDPDRPSVMNYGAIGSIIGHEISHSFDDHGSQFDSRGRLRDWWTPEDRAHFHAAGQLLVAQFNAYHPLPDLAVNGQQTLDENIADVAGLSAAYHASHLADAAAASAAAPLLDGFNSDQLFFISFALNWRAKYRDPMLRLIVVSDGHSPSMYRADTVRNIDAWYSAFDVKPGEALYLAPAERVRMW